MLLWEKPLPVLSLNRDPLTSFNAPVFPQRDQKGCSKTSTGLTRSITSTPHRQAQSQAHPIDKHSFSHSNQRAHSRRRQNFLTHSLTAQPGPWITGKSAPSTPPLHESLGEAATGSFLESRSPDVIQRTRFPPERSERMLKDKHRFDQINHKHTP